MKPLSEDRKEKILQAHELAPSTWVKGMVNESGLPLEFSNHRFLIDIYNDLSPLQVILKPPQIGATTMNVFKALWVASHLDKQIIYTLPTATDMYEMVGSGFNRIIAQNPELRELVNESDTMYHKQVGNGLIRFRGTSAAKQAMMVPSDLNIHDEVDASDSQIITQYETRLQAKADGWRWYFSHPSLAGSGVDVYWNQSDKKEWFVNPTCRHEQYLQWPSNIQNGKYVCAKCGTSISGEEIIAGDWVPTSKGAFSGYHISQLMCPWISAGKIIEAFEDQNKSKQYFYNYVLGLPYLGSEDKIEPSVVLRNCVDIVNEQEGRTIIGADTGKGIHYVLMNKDGVFYYDHESEITASKDPYDAIRGHLKRFSRSIAVFDQGGDLIGVRKLQAEYPGRVFLCFYNKDKKSLDLVKWGEGDRYGEVHVDRNRMMQLVVEQLRDIGRIRFNGTPDEWVDFAEHFSHIYREKIVVHAAQDKDDRTLYGNEFVWKRDATQRDHFVHALLYAIVGLQRYGGELAKVVEQDGWGKSAVIVADEGVRAVEVRGASQEIILGHSYEF